MNIVKNFKITKTMTLEEQINRLAEEDTLQVNDEIVQAFVVDFKCLNKRHLIVASPSATIYSDDDFLTLLNINGEIIKTKNHDVYKYCAKHNKKNCYISVILRTRVCKHGGIKKGVIGVYE